MKDLGYPDKNSAKNLGTLWFMMLFIGLRMVFLLLYKIFRNLWTKKMSRKISLCNKNKKN